ncbi:hypothetical protein Dimus_014784 [Dionaea muscipula]
MDVGDEDKLVLNNGNGDCVSYHSPHLSSDWQYNGANFTTSSSRLIPGASSMPICKDDLVGPSCSSVPMADSFHPTIWHHTTPNPESIALNEIDVHSSSGVVPGSSSRIGAQVGWAAAAAAASSVFKEGLFLPSLPGVLPHSCLSHLPIDAAFIERAARFSSFNAGNLSDMVNPFSIPQSMGPFLHGGTGSNAINAMSHKNELIMAAHTSFDVSPPATDHHGAVMEGMNDPRSEMQLDEAQGVEDSDEAELSGGTGTKEDEPMIDIGDDSSSAKGLDPMKKRKRGGQGVEPEQTIGVGEQFGEEFLRKGGQNPTSIANKAATTGKQSSGASDPSKGEYIHVRARRGQATNSHSLAERVRREKISERMKLLQDLVPGCSKVTGKAVMLGEIINYVQSLQRQVEFLSMKLATVNPRLDFNLDGLLPKDMLLAQPGPSATSMGFSARMPIVYPPPPPPHNPPEGPTVYQPGVPTIGNSSQLHTSHVLPNVWEEDEFHGGGIQIGFNAVAPLNSQDTNSGTTPPHGHMKVEH